MKIGQAASATGLTIKAIRHYESVGLVGAVRRTGKYRDFSASDVERLRLIAHCRGLGFGLDEIQRVLALVVEAEPQCPDAGAMLDVVVNKLTQVRCELRELEAIEQRLSALTHYLEQRRGSVAP